MRIAPAPEPTPSAVETYMSFLYPGKDVARWRVFAVAYLLMVLFAFPLQSLPPMFGLILRDIPFTHSREGFLMGSYGIPGLFMPVAAAALAARFDPRRVIIWGIVLLALGQGLFAVSDAYWQLLVSRILAGFGGKIILSLAPLLVLLRFRGAGLGFAVGVFNTAVPLGSILSMNCFAGIGPVFGWRFSSALISIMSLVMLVATLATVRNRSETESPETIYSQDGSILRRIWHLTLLNFLINALSLAYITFAPQFYRENGVPAAEAAFFPSLILVESAVIGPLAGLAAEKPELRRLLLAASSIIIAVSLLLMPFPGMPLYVWTLVMGAGAAVVPVIIFPLLNEILEPNQVGMGIALLIIASNLGGTTGPFIFGSILDAGGGFPLGFTFLAVLSLLMLPVIARVRPKKPLETLPAEQPEG